MPICMTAPPYPSRNLLNETLLNQLKPEQLLSMHRAVGIINEEALLQHKKITDLLH